MQVHFWLPYPQGSLSVPLQGFLKVESNGLIFDVADDNTTLLARPVNDLRAVYNHVPTGIEFREWSVTQ